MALSDPTNENIVELYQRLMTLRSQAAPINAPNMTTWQRQQSVVNQEYELLCRGQTSKKVQTCHRYNNYVKV